MIAWLAGCATMHGVPHYEPVGYHVSVPSDGLLAAMPDLLEGDVGTRRLRALTTPDDEPARELPPEAQYGVLYTERWARGGELDLRIDLGRGPYLVQVRWTPERAADVQWATGEPVRAPIPAAPLDEWQDRLATRFGLSGFADGTVAWRADEVADLADALGRMTDAERRVLSGISLVRDGQSPRAARRELAWFDPGTEPPTLSFFDLAFDNEADSFVGPVEEPVAAGVMTALHEFGHLLADAPLRRAYEEYTASYDRWVDFPSAPGFDRSTDTLLKRDWREKYRDYRHLGRSGPVIEAWQAFRAGRVGPSSYGFRDPNESFAEAFALYHLDPDALDRALPGAVAWFREGRHLEAAGLVDPPSSRR